MAVLLLTYLSLWPQGTNRLFDIQFTPLSGKLSLFESPTQQKMGDSSVNIVAFTGIDLKEQELKLFLSSCVKQVSVIIFLIAYHFKEKSGDICGQKCIKRYKLLPLPLVMLNKSCLPLLCIGWWHNTYVIDCFNTHVHRFFKSSFLKKLFKCFLFQQLVYLSVNRRSF